MGKTPDTEREKELAAQAAAELVDEGMSVGLGTGSTVAYLLPALARRGLGIRCAATSPATESAARELGLELAELDEICPLDIAVDGTDQVSPERWLVKGGGGAHTREKIVAAAARRFIVIASSDKPVARLGPPVPLELSAFGLRATLQKLSALGEVTLRDAPPSPDGGVIADYMGEVRDPTELAAELAATPGVIAHGLFPPSMVDEVLVGRGDSVEPL